MILLAVKQSNLVSAHLIDSLVFLLKAVRMRGVAVSPTRIIRCEIVGSGNGGCLRDDRVVRRGPVERIRVARSASAVCAGIAVAEWDCIKRLLVSDAPHLMLYDLCSARRIGAWVFRGSMTTQGDNTLTSCNVRTLFHSFALTRRGC